jgi:hypothetical protein
MTDVARRSAATAREQLPARPAHAYPIPLRLAVACLLAASGVSLWLVLGLVFLATNPPVTPPMLFRLFGVLVLLPWLGGRLLRRVVAGELALTADDLVFRRPGLTVEVPREAISAVVPWRVPVPGPGCSIRLRSGRRFRWGFELSDPAPLLGALGTGDRSAAMRVILAWARARAARRPPRWYHLATKFPLFALLPTALLFNVHQHIAYGGLFGEWYLLGAGSWFQTLAVYYLTVTIYLVLFASLWRGLGEAVALLGTAVAPARAAGVRRAVEVACRVLYFGGVPVLLLVRFLP